MSLPNTKKSRIVTVYPFSKWTRPLRSFRSRGMTKPLTGTTSVVAPVSGFPLVLTDDTQGEDAVRSLVPHDYLALKGVDA